MLAQLLTQASPSPVQQNNAAVHLSQQPGFNFVYLCHGVNVPPLCPIPSPSSHTPGAKPDTNPGPFAAKPPFWERPLFAVWPMAQADPLAAEAQLVADDPSAFSGVKDDYDRSRRTLTRTGGLS
jgi:hypothetical protein